MSTVITHTFPWTMPWAAFSIFPTIFINNTVRTNLTGWRWANTSENYTVLAIGNGPKPCLCSNFVLFKKAWQMLRVLLHLSPLGSYLPLLRPFQRGTVWPWTSRDIENTTVQRVIQYLIGKVSVVVNMSQEGWGVAALLTSIRSSWKVQICYINGAMGRF